MAIIEDEKFAEDDGLAISEETSLMLDFSADSEVILFDLPA